MAYVVCTENLEICIREKYVHMCKRESLKSDCRAADLPYHRGGHFNTSNRGKGHKLTCIPTRKSIKGRTTSRRIDHDTYLLIARQIIGSQVQDQTRVPGAERPALLQELEQWCREVNHIIATLDRKIEELEALGLNVENYTRQDPYSGIEIT